MPDERKGPTIVCRDCGDTFTHQKELVLQHVDECDICYSLNIGNTIELMRRLDAGEFDDLLALPN